MAADPYTGFFTGVGQGVGKGLGNAMSDTGVTLNTASSATYGTQLGGTGWVINFGGGDVSNDATNRQTSEPPASTGNDLGTWSYGAESGGGAGVAVAVVALIVVAVAYRMRKGRR